MVGALFPLTAFACLATAPSRVLIVHDELPAMQALAARLKREEEIEAGIIEQPGLPTDLTPYAAVVVYIHGNLLPSAEEVLIRYAEAGGKLVLLHHTISSGKRANQRWLSWLGVGLREGPPEEGGYKWIEEVTLGVRRTRARHFITSHLVKWPAGGIRLHGSEVYLNHHLSGRRQRLLELDYTDPSGRRWEQQTAGWIRRAGKGWVVYLMPGHTSGDFGDDVYGRVVLNAIIWKP